MNTVRIKYSASFLLNLPVLKVFCKVKVCKVISLLIFQNSLRYINNVKKAWLNGMTGIHHLPILMKWKM